MQSRSNTISDKALVCLPDTGGMIKWRDGAMAVTEPPPDHARTVDQLRWLGNKESDELSSRPADAALALLSRNALVSDDPGKPHVTRQP